MKNLDPLSLQKHLFFKKINCDANFMTYYVADRHSFPHFQASVPSKVITSVSWKAARIAITRPIYRVCISSCCDRHPFTHFQTEVHTSTLLHCLTSNTTFMPIKHNSREGGSMRGKGWTVLAPFTELTRHSQLGPEKQ